MISSLPPGKTAIGCKWIFKIKYHSDGTVKRYKARLVVLGNRPVEDLDYNETFAPVAKISLMVKNSSVFQCESSGDGANGEA